MKHYSILQSTQYDKTVLDFTEHVADDVKDWLLSIYLGNGFIDRFPKLTKSSKTVTQENIPSNVSSNGHTNGYDNFELEDGDLAVKLSSLTTLDLENPLNDFADNVYDKGKMINKKNKKSSRKGKLHSAYSVYKETNKNNVATPR